MNLSPKAAPPITAIYPKNLGRGQHEVDIVVRKEVFDVVPEPKEIPFGINIIVFSFDSKKMFWGGNQT